MNRPALRKSLYFLLPGMALITLLPVIGCAESPDRVGPSGVVEYYNHVPSSCDTVRGLRQKELIPVHSEKRLREHYGMTFHVWFNDGVTEELYGTLYYQNEKENLYCMALPDGNFAVFHDRMVDRHKKNIAHEICYPLRECLKDPGEAGSL